MPRNLPRVMDSGRNRFGFAFGSWTTAYSKFPALIYLTGLWIPTVLRAWPWTNSPPAQEVESRHISWIEIAKSCHTMTHHVISRGAKRISFFSNYAWTPFMRDRYQGYPARFEPALQFLRDKLAAVIAPKVIRHPVLLDRFAHPLPHDGTTQCTVGSQHVALADVFILAFARLRPHRCIRNEVPRPDMNTVCHPRGHPCGYFSSHLLTFGWRNPRPSARRNRWVCRLPTRQPQTAICNEKPTFSNQQYICPPSANLGGLPLSLNTLCGGILVTFATGSGQDGFRCQ